MIQKLAARTPHLLVVAGCAVLMGACTATIETRDPVTGETEITYVDAPPLDLGQYHHESYDGRDVYLVGDRWVYQVDGRWVTYRHEPPPLKGRRPHSLP